MTDIFVSGLNDKIFGKRHVFVATLDTNLILSRIEPNRKITRHLVHHRIIEIG